MYQKSLFYWFISYILRFICLFSHDTFFVDIQTRTGTFSDVIDKTYNQDIQYINNLLRYPYINPKTLSCISVKSLDSYQYIVGIRWSRFRTCSRTQNKNPDNNSYLRFFSSRFFSCYFSVISWSFFRLFFWDFFIFLSFQGFSGFIFFPKVIVSHLFYPNPVRFFRLLQDFHRKISNTPLEIFFDPLEDFFGSRFF